MNDLTSAELRFLELAKKGFFSSRAELSAWDIALLRFPNDRNARWRWWLELNSAIHAGKLPRPNATTTIIRGNLTLQAYHIPASAYRDYIILQRLFGNPIPDDSLERCWLPDLPPEVSPSDAALGKQRREQLQEFSRRGNQERKQYRAVEHDRWRKEAQRIEAASGVHKKIELARRVKKTLELPDSVGAIRKKL